MELIINFLIYCFFFLVYTSGVGFSLFENYSFIINIISFFILVFVIFNLKDKIINIFIILSFFNILLITVWSEIFYWCNISGFILPIPLINLCCLPLILHFLGLLNSMLIIFILKITSSFSFLFNLIISLFLVNPIFIFFYFLTLIIISFSANLFLIYFIYSLIFNICLVILRMPYLFEFIDSSNIIENLVYLKANLDKLDSSYIITENSLVSNLVFSIMVSAYKNKNDNTRFITTTTKAQTGLTELALAKFFKIKGIYIKPETLKALVLIAQEHPRQTASLLIAVGVPVTYAFIIHGYTLKLNHEIKLMELKNQLQIQLSKDQTIISNNQTIISNNQTIISNNEAIISNNKAIISNNELELAKLKQSTLQVVDVTPVSIKPSTSQTTTNESGGTCILQSPFEAEETLEFFSIFLNNFLSVFFDIMLWLYHNII